MQIGLNLHKMPGTGLADDLNDKYPASEWLTPFCKGRLILRK